MRKIKKSCIAFLFASGLTACGGGGGAEGGESEPSPPVPSNSRIISGAIQELSAGKVRVNGQWFNVSGAKIQYANDAWVESLQVGMDVEIAARVDQAEIITLNPLLTGQLASVAAARGTTMLWSVNGIPLDKVEQAQSAGNWVMVFGDYDSQGVVVTRELLPLATRPTWIEIEGRVQGHNSAAKRFTLGQLQVEYQGAHIEDGGVQEGRWVEVFGRLAGNVLQATELDFDDIADLPDQSELEGWVHYFDKASGLLELDRQRQIMVTAQTRFDGGSLANLQAGIRVEVEVRNDGVGLVATEIEFDDEASSAPGLSEQFKLAGAANWNGQQLTINSIPFQLDSMTHFEDGLNQSALDGRWVELSGIIRQGVNLVREIESEIQDGELELTGQVKGNTLWGYSGGDGSLQQFAGQWVAVDCYFDGNVLTNCRRDD
ncbi:DUF5666 domain-containing protein [Aeromonas veronii]